MSLRRSFILVFSALLTALAAFAAAFSYYSARNEAWSILDFQLQQIAGVVGDGSGLLRQRVPGGASDEIVAIRIVSGDQPAVTNDVSVQFPEKPSPGLTTFRTGSDEWRLFTDLLPERTVMVAQRTSERDELAADAAWNSAWPFLLAIPLSWLAAYWLVGAIMERLQSLAAKVEARGIDEHHPLSVDDAPLEVQPLVTAINRAFDKVRLTLEQQRIFLADAAHELRTPLAALNLQIDNLKQATKPDDKAATLAEVEAGLRRATQVATQLLKLARSENVEQRADFLPVCDIELAVQECLARFLAQADAKDIDLGLVQPAQCKVRIEPLEIAAILDIVVDNALRYAPEQATVDLSLSVEGRACVITVTDSGPGIPEEFRERVFDRFFRLDPSQADGTGLGLAIARNLATRYGGAISLDDNPAGSGLRVILRFPLA